MNKHWKSLAAALALVSVLGVAGCCGLVAVCIDLLTFSYKWVKFQGPMICQRRRGCKSKNIQFLSSCFRCDAAEKRPGKRSCVCPGAVFFPRGLRTVSAAYSALLSASSMGIFRMRRKSKIVTMA